MRSVHRVLLVCVLALALYHGFAEAADEKPAEPEHAAEKLKDANVKPSEKLGSKLKKRLSARHHHNEGMTLNHTHTRSKFRPGSLHHFEHMERVGSAHAHMFNLFRLSGDFLHLGAFGFLLYHLHSTKNCAGHPFDCLVSFLWAFSIYLEAVAIIPQLMLLKRKKIVKNLTGNYIFCLGAYRALYLVNWFYRYFVDPISAPEFFIKVMAGIVQTALFFNFFVIYINNKRNNLTSDVIMA